MSLLIFQLTMKIVIIYKISYQLILGKLLLLINQIKIMQKLIMVKDSFKIIMCQYLKRKTSKK